MNDHQKVSVEHSINAYFNAFLQEWKLWDLKGNNVVIPLGPGKGSLRLKLRYESPLERHRFHPEILLNEGTRRTKISLDLASAHISSILKIQYPDIQFEFEKFQKRLKNSIDNIASFIENRDDLASEKWNPPDFLNSEQALILGHNFHPTPKSREHLSHQDMKTYCPELKGSFELSWYVIDKDLLYLQSSQALQSSGEPFPSQSVFNALNSTVHDDDSKVFFPVHPIQEKGLLKKDWFNHNISSGRIVRTCSESGTWFPTSSVRAIYHSEAPYMIKSSLDIRLTNSFRRLNIQEAKRGLIFQDIMCTDLLRPFHERNPHFAILHEPAFGVLKDQNGIPDDQSLVVFRQNPFRYGEQKQIGMLATLTQDHPTKGKPLLIQMIRNLSDDNSMTLNEATSLWFDKFLRTAMQPLLELACEYGIFGSSHQQNMLVKFEGNLPVKSYFRDCQGTAYLADFLPDLLRKTRINQKDCLVFSDEVSFHLFGYYYFFNSCFSVISTLACYLPVTEKNLLSQLKDFLATLKQKQYRDNRFIDHFLTSRTLMTKSNFLCSTYNIQESTMNNPLDIYIEKPNPLPGTSQGDKACSF